MLKKVIKFTNYDGVEVSKEFYFNLNKMELMEMQLGTKGGLDKKIKDIVASQDANEIFKFFKEIILKSIGEKSADGMRFIKNEEIRQGFEQSEAYASLFVELSQNEKAATDFINGVLPADLVKQANNPAIENK